VNATAMDFPEICVIFVMEVSPEKLTPKVAGILAVAELYTNTIREMPSSTTKINTPFFNKFFLVRLVGRSIESLIIFKYTHTA
jgi:hypothetical protein